MGSTLRVVGIPAWAGLGAALTVALAFAGPADADAIQTDGALSEAPQPARVTVSRAADLVGTPVYFAQARGLGSAGVVTISSRRLPAGAVFSVALRPAPVPAASGLSSAASLARLSLSGLSLGGMPSQMPVAARALTSGFGLRQHPILGGLRAHNGLDLAAPYGSPVVATSDGVVDAATWYGGYGLFVALDHGGGLQTRYGHLSRLNVAAGQPIRKGDVIGYVGSTGRSTGAHLHYEIRLDGRPVDPTRTLSGR